MIERHADMSRVIAIIGTAGRDKRFPMGISHWDFMCRAVRVYVRPGDHLVSGGAAWADHAAGWAFNEGLSDSLTLHLPAPFDSVFSGGNSTSGGASNHYHGQFSRAIRRDTLADIQEAIIGGAQCTYQPESNGYAAMFARNRLVTVEASHLQQQSQSTVSLCLPPLLCPTMG